VRARYRRWYHGLPPQVQMIGLQLWLPLLLVLAFSFCYVAAFHAPAPRDVPVGVVAGGQAPEALARNLAARTGPTFAFREVASPGSARRAVLDGELTAAIVPGRGGEGTASVLVASAASFQLEQVVRQAVAAASDAEGRVQLEDLAPLPAHDAYGTSLFYLALAWTIGSYVGAMFVGLMGNGLPHRTRFLLVAAITVPLCLVATVITGPLLGAVDGHLPALCLLGSAAGLSIGLFVNGLGFYVGRYLPGVALVLLVFLNIPASGGAFPPELVPGFFAWLHPFALGTGLIGALRDVVYGVDNYLWPGLATLGAYGVVGLTLAALGKPWLERKQRRREERGAPPPMIEVAQRALMDESASPGGRAGDDDESTGRAAAGQGAAAGATS
jgi:hypothetical protein